MGHKVIKWIATDEEEFNDEKSMILHELSLLDKAEIDFFLTDMKAISGSKLTEYKKILNAWQRYVRESTNNLLVNKVENIVEDMSPEELAKAYEGILNTAQLPEWIPEGGPQLVEGYRGYEVDEVKEKEAIDNSFKKATRI